MFYLMRNGNFVPQKNTEKGISLKNGNWPLTIFTFLNVQNNVVLRTANRIDDYAYVDCCDKWKCEPDLYKVYQIIYLSVFFARNFTSKDRILVYFDTYALIFVFHFVHQYYINVVA